MGTHVRTPTAMLVRATTGFLLRRRRFLIGRLAVSVLLPRQHRLLSTGQADSANPLELQRTEGSPVATIRFNNPPGRKITGHHVKLLVTIPRITRVLQGLFAMQANPVQRIPVVCPSATYLPVSLLLTLTCCYLSAAVNSMSLEFMTALDSALAGLEVDNTCRGLILASAVPRVFSAGLDINEMWNPDEARLRKFWQSLQNLWLRLYSSPLATVAAIQGNSPAGGCLLAACCDARVMSAGDDSKDPPKPFVIGLNETRLGIVAPSWFADTLLNTVNSRRTAERLLTRGDLITSQEALACQLVDSVVPTADVMAAAEAEMDLLLSVSDRARHASKMLLRQPAIDDLLAKKQDEEDWFVSLALSSPVQASLTAYMKALQGRSKN